MQKVFRVSKDCRWLEYTDVHAYNHSHENEISRAISLVAGNILTLSLIENLDGVLLHYDSLVQVQRNQFRHSIFGYTNLTGCIEDIMKSFSVTSCSVTEVLIHLLSLLQHDVKDDISIEQWVMSAFRGQVVYPRIFESGIITQYNTLELVCLQSVLLQSPDYIPTHASTKGQFTLTKSLMTLRFSTHTAFSMYSIRRLRTR